MKRTIITISILLICTSCATNKSFSLRESVGGVYNGSPQNTPCEHLSDGEVTRREAAYCIASIYLYETNQNLPKIDSLAFKDVAPGDPYLPYIWITISTGILSPENYQHFGSKIIFSQNQWKQSLERLKEKVKKWEEQRSTFRLSHDD